MTTRHYATILCSAAALLALGSLPGPATATELAVPTQVVEKPQAVSVPRPAIRTARRPATFVRRSYRPVRYGSRPVVAPIRYAALERRWSQVIFLGVGF
jgi:hypothetical protein